MKTRFARERLAMERGKFDEIRGLVVEARRAFGALVYGGQSGEVPLELMASAGQCYYGLSVASESFDKLMAMFGDGVPAREEVMLIEASAVSVAPAKTRGYRTPRNVQRERAEKAAAPVDAGPIRRSQAEVAASRARGAKNSAQVRQERSETRKSEGGRGALKLAVRAAFDAHPGEALSLKAVCEWLLKNRREAVKHLVKPGTAVYQCLLKMTAAGELEKGTTTAGAVVWSEV